MFRKEFKKGSSTVLVELGEPRIAMKTTHWSEKPWSQCPTGPVGPNLAKQADSTRTVEEPDASSKLTPCLRWFTATFFVSHAKLMTIQWLLGWLI